MVLSFFNLGAWGALYAVTPEVYPTALRATGAGAAAGFGRLASIAAPLCVPPLLDAGGTGLVFGTFAAFFVLGALATLGAARAPRPGARRRRSPAAEGLVSAAGPGARSAGMSLDPAETNPQHYKVVFENDRVRVLEYTDQPGDSTTPHEHPDSVMYTLSSFRRRLLRTATHQRDVELTAGTAGWLPAQQHAGENIGDTRAT